MNPMELFEWIAAQPAFIVIPLFLVFGCPLGWVVMLMTPPGARAAILVPLAVGCCVVFGIAVWEAKSEGASNRAAVRRGINLVLGLLLLLPILIYPWTMRVLSPTDHIWRR